MKLLITAIALSAALINFGNRNNVEPAPLFPETIIARVAPQKETREERLYRLAHEYAVPEKVFESAYEIETTSGANIKPKFEAHIVSWLLSKERSAEFRAKVKAFATTKEKMRILASSHGALQVMGFHALDYGVDPMRLAKDPVLQDTLGMVRLSHAWLKSGKETKQELKRVAITGKNYNGSWEYAQKMVNVYKKVS